MSIENKLTTIAENEVKVYEAGKKAEYDAFWDSYQNGGNRVQYPFAFYLWDGECFKPKYPIIFGTNVSSQDTFSYASITEVGVDIIVQEGFNIHSAFYDCSNLKTIKKIIITENSTIDNHCFDGCRSLTSIQFVGTLGQSINFQWSPLLDKASIENIFSVLSSSASGKTLTLNKSAKEAAFTGSEWEQLKATKSNWNIVLI